MRLIRLEPRAAVSPHFIWLSPLIALGLTVITGLVVFAALGVDPVQGFVVFFLYPLKTIYGISELLLKATPLMLCGLGLAIGFRASVWNIGAEGQFVLGAIGATGVALALGASMDRIWVLSFMAIAGAAGGALWAAIPALLRTRFNANEILVSLMLVYVAQFLLSWLVFGPWKDPDGLNFPQTKLFEDEALLPVFFEGNRLNFSFVISICLLIIGHLFMRYSFEGFKMRVAGEAWQAARYAGFSTDRAIWFGMLAGGIGAGIAGMAEVAGPAGQLTDKISVGYGFAAIIVAFIGRLSAPGIFLSSLLMALFFIGGEQAQHYLNLPPSLSKVFQGLVLFFLLSCDILIDYRIRIRCPLGRTQSLKQQ